MPQVVPRRACELQGSSLESGREDQRRAGSWKEGRGGTPYIKVGLQVGFLEYIEEFSPYSDGEILIKLLKKNAHFSSRAFK